MTRPTRKLTLHGEIRKCFTSYGKAKRPFKTQWEAWEFINLHKLSLSTRPYECEFHGWHIGRGPNSTGAKKSNRRKRG